MKMNTKNINKKKILICTSFLIFSIACNILEQFEQRIENNRLENQSKATSANDEKYLLEKFPCIPYPRVPEYELVTKVIDGDSIVVSLDKIEYEVRYIGINAPEFEDNTFDAALLSKKVNQELVEGKRIILFRDVSNKDRYGRLLRYIFLDDLFINLELVERGFAQPKSYPPDIACQETLNSAGKNDK